MPPAMTHLIVAIAGILLILAIVWDAFEALVLPRTATRTLRPARLFYQTSWPAWVAMACFLARGRRRENDPRPHDRQRPSSSGARRR